MRHFESNLQARLLKDSGDSFTRLKAQGFYGEEDRLSWSETLKTTAQRLKLPKFKYSIRPQQNLPTIGPGYTPALLLSQSIMDIEADLLHEGDFIEISEQLSNMPGLFRVLGCELTKEKNVTLTEPHKNVALKCLQAWYTLQYSPEDEEMLVDDIDMEVI